MNKIALAKYWYFRFIDTFSTENIEKIQELDWQKNKLEIYLKKKSIKPQKGLDIKERISLRLEAVSHYGKDFQDCIHKSKEARQVYKKIWKKNPDGLTYSEFLEKDKGKRSISQLMAAANRIEPFDYHVEDESNLQECLKKDNLELIYLLPPTQEKFINDYTYKYVHRDNELEKKELENLEKFLSSIEPPFDPEFEKFLRSIGIGYFEAIKSKIFGFIKTAIKIIYELRPALSISSKVPEINNAVEKSDVIELPDKHLAENDKYIFVCKGDGWNIVFEGKDYIIRHTKGMDYIAYLLRHENKEFPIQLLTQAFSDNIIDDPQGYSHMNKDELEALGLYTDQPDPIGLVDRATLDNVRKEMRELKKDREEALRNGDIGKEDEINIKISALEKYVLQNTQPGGYAKNVDNPEKREIRRVSKVIVTALNNIKNKDEKLYIHLDNSIQKGQIFYYKPDRSLDWTLI